MTLAIMAAFLIGIIVVAITGGWDWVAAVVLPNTTLGLYDREFFENVLVEAHGMLLDLIVVGVVIYWFERRSQRSQQIRESVKEIADLSFNCAPELSHRTFNAIKRLLDLGEPVKALSQAKLSGLKIEKIELSSANLHAVDFTQSELALVSLKNCTADAADFTEAKLVNCSFVGTSLRRAKFKDAKLDGMDFSKCKIQRADFSGASLRNAVFTGVDCSKVNFDGADVRSANFIGATNLTQAMLSRARNHAYAKLYRHP